SRLDGSGVAAQDRYRLGDGAGGSRRAARSLGAVASVARGVLLTARPAALPLARDARAGRAPRAAPAGDRADRMARRRSMLGVLETCAGRFRIYDRVALAAALARRFRRRSEDNRRG